RSGGGLLHLWFAARRQFLFRSLGEGPELSGDELRGYCSAGSFADCISPFWRSSLHARSCHAVTISLRAESFGARLANDPRVNSARQGRGRSFAFRITRLPPIATSSKQSRAAGSNRD